MPRPVCGDVGGLNDRGQPCGTANGLQEDGRCFRHSAHTADRIEDARRNVKKGQQAWQHRRKPIREDELPPKLETVEDAMEWLAWTARNVAIGRLRHPEGQAIARSLQEWLKAFSLSDTGNRAAAVKAELEKLKAQLKREQRMGVVR